MTLHKLNFVGVQVADYEASYTFYTGVLGMGVSNERAGWADFDTTGMTFELFERDFEPPAERAWGRGQAARPAIEVWDLPATVARLERAGVRFDRGSGGSSGDSVEMIAPEGIRWSLSPSGEAGRDLRRPHLAGVALKVRDLAAQKRFYAEVMGLEIAEEDDRRAVLRQGPGEPWLRLEAGGSAALRGPLSGAEHPVEISFETLDAERASAVLERAGVEIHQPVTRKSWGGIDLYVRDADGFPLQVVQYLSGPGWSSES